jgi:hypothetical protein
MVMFPGASAECVCIIGTGPAGITIARKLSGAKESGGHSVLASLLVEQLRVPSPGSRGYVHSSERSHSYDGGVGNRLVVGSLPEVFRGRFGEVGNSLPAQSQVALHATGFAIHVFKLAGPFAGNAAQRSLRSVVM